MSALIELSHIDKRYRRGEEEIRALHDLSLIVGSGEFVAVVGRSGSGKSTLMNILGCLDLPTAGTYRLDGRDMCAMPDRVLSRVRNHHIGFVFQGFNLIPQLTALENVELPLLYRGMPRQQRRTLALDCLRQVGLDDRLHHRPAELSGGQQQRVAVARALAARPPLVLADEPTGNLDRDSGRDVMAVLHRLHAQGTTIVLITHDQTVAAQASRQLCLCDGRLTNAV